MMYVRMNGAEKSWNVGSKFPFTYPDIDRAARSNEYTFTVQADGDEQELIEYSFPNLPQSRNTVAIWHGEFAQFIIANLALKYGG